MKAKLKTLKRGQTFYGAGIQWLVLGHTNSSQGLPVVTHIVSTGIVERRAFDEKNRNDLGVSTLLAYLNGEFLERLEDAFGKGAVAEHFIDLTSNDGLKDYGNDESTIEVSEEELYKAAVQKFGERAQILVAIEEMSELTKALLKHIRHEDFNQGDYDDIVESIAEERADVSIMLNQLTVIFGKNEDAETEKLEHLADIVKDAL